MQARLSTYGRHPYRHSTAILSPAARRCCKSDLQVVVLCHTPVHGDLHPAGSAVTIIQGAMEVPWMSKTSGPDRPRKCSGIKLT